MNPLRASIVLVGVSIVVALAATGRSSKDAGGFTELQRAPIASSPGLEVVMGLVEQSGASSSPKHLHPHGEFAFVIEGSVTVIGEDGPAAVVAAGQSFHQPAGRWHIVSSSEAGARSVVFRVVDKGEPMVVVVD